MHILFRWQACIRVGGSWLLKICIMDEFQRVQQQAQTFSEGHNNSFNALRLPTFKPSLIPLSVEACDSLAVG